MKYFLIGCSVILGFSLLAGCGETQSPVEIKTYDIGNGERMEIIAVTDQVTVEKVMINRGHCRGIFFDVGPGKFMMKEIVSMKPHTIKFGEKMIITAACAVKEVDLETDTGSFTFSFES